MPLIATESGKKIFLTEDGRKLVTVLPGDGIGPECVESTLRILEAARAPLAFEIHEAGASVFKKGLASGVPPETVESIRKTRVVLKGPLEECVPSLVDFGSAPVGALRCPPVRLLPCGSPQGSS